MTTHDLLFELGGEELPPKSLKKLSQSLLDGMAAGLQEAGLNFSEARAYATPRRLAVIVRNLDSQQADKVVEKRGPALQAAYGPDGTPSKAALGFATSCAARFEQLETLETDKGAWLIFKQAVKGQATVDLIPDIIRQSLAQLPIAKRMRWGAYEHEFVRPVHNAVLLFGNEVIDTGILGLKTDRHSFGHRFLSPGAIELHHPNDYVDKLLAAKVTVDFAQRMQQIETGAQKAAAQLGGIAHIEDDLLEEVAALNEWPVPVVGNFDARFLALPQEVLITTMQSNQKYFPVKNAQGGLLPHFITFANIESSNPAAIRAGNERVVLPRLVDAEFFWNQDRKQSLANRVDRLKTIVFQKDLGSLFDKTERVAHLAGMIAERLDADAMLAKRAALLAKTDLMTLMVGEFANLQGTMGRYYAAADGEDAAVALALEEQYFPRQSGGEIPQAPVSVALALAEKIDTLAGIFSVGLIPTGDKDPYALRRATLGILRTVIENGLALDVVELLDAALAQFAHPFDKAETRQKVSGFIFDRLKGYCLDHGFSSDEFEAVLAINPTRPFDFWLRLKAVQAFRALPEAESLAAANKRIINILRKSEQVVAETIGTLIEAQEKNLLVAAETAETAIAPLLAEGNYPMALSRLAQLRDTVDAFFDHVMVNTDDEALRNSRLALLAKLSNQFLKIADISKLQA
ncbi:MAG: glycine--tRNA ligase subunit beta [Methylomonas sp.]|nr:glycine--tRNA ligase subunit beta [Methylomonas sp.]PPD22829.1 MAG: glycine--tRNA ligase subunit beta [Methylomonas sp.]PPD25423.1 MAG: glycine--tRNA ligase subunit beta [Methylomonas sp.]PPD36070.1 MAG: glycine--tRNA ligase subunit beta [Methylomonas sp.]PPD42734.1 MAG: glycine--tRNA ligase subunit beta [Methylomonas sp.]